MYIVFIIMGIAFLVGVIVYLVKKYEKKRTEELAECFQYLSFRSVEQRELPDFKITSRGHSRRRYNNFEGRSSGLDLSIFDYRYTVGGGKNQHTYNITIAMTNASLPVFQLSKEGLFQKLVDKFSPKDIDFEDYRIFSEKYLLKGDDEQAIRKTFTPEVLCFFESDEPCYVESNGSKLIFCKPNKRIKPENMNEFLEKVKQCFKRL